MVDRCWEQLNTGIWSDVPECWRFMNYLSSLLLVKAMWKVPKIPNSDLFSLCQEMLEECDRALLMGRNPFMPSPSPLCQLASGFQAFLWKHTPILYNDNSSVGNVVKKRIFDLQDFHYPDEVIQPLQRYACPTLEEFHKLTLLQEPFILEKCVDHWPAMQPAIGWSISQLLCKAGYRTVPVEVGSSYDRQNWTQKLMTIQNFVRQYLSGSSSEERGYLAQHCLFDQIPELADDIDFPDYIDSPLVERNIWIGPCGTVSPLHHDPKQNLFVQVNGWKYVKLYPAALRDCIYPYNEMLLINTSQVNVEQPDLKRFPLFASARGWHGVLAAGEMMYIPARCWHYVRSLSMSFSVNFWWESELHEQSNE